MNPIDLIAILHRSESETLDFKGKQYPFSQASDGEKSELLKDILSIANAWKDSDGYIVIGVEEENGRAKRICGADILDDSDVQQFVNSKTNCPVSFRIDIRKHEGVNLTIIQIDKDQRRPIFLTKNFGQLKSNAVYIRRGSSTAEATPDEIADIGRDRSFTQQKEEKEKLFWKTFRIFFSRLEQRVFYIKNTNHFYESTIAENRLPLDEASSLLKNANEIDLDDKFRILFAKLVDKIRSVDEYMNLGSAKIKELFGNFHNEKESLYALVCEIKQAYLK